MQWANEPQAGFSTAKKTVTPVIRTWPYGYDRINVESQRLDVNSMLNWTERMIRLRKECPEFGWGTYKILRTACSNVLAIHYEWRNNAVVTLHNFHEKPCTILIEIGGKESDTLTNLLPGEPSHALPNGKHKIVLEGFAYRWYRVGGLGHILKREKY
jgi:maltose alpha-D-glucosyltransferase / alpha-amylase